jgi:Zn-dependent peptidase ImmA (M78 family)/ribosome-binding protein aMBF1 (putative translation factor)
VALTQHQLGARIGRARERAGLSQVELGARVQLTQSAVSRIESGERGVDSLELAAIAEALDVSVLDLLESEPVGEELRVAARLDEATEPATVDRALNRVLDVVRLDRLLDELGEPERGQQERTELDPPRNGAPVQQGQRLAERVRKLWSLGDDPLPSNLFSLIEDQSGLGIALEPLQERIAGLCARVGDLAIALIDSSAVVGRQRFTAVHELCHLLVGDGEQVLVDERLTGRSLVEMRANAFAAHFLMPAKAVRRYLRDRAVDEEVVVELQYTFGVSLDALLWHLVNLDLISDYRREQIHAVGPKALAFRYGYGGEWNRLEHERNIRRPPRPVHQRALAAYSKGLIGIEPLADLVGRRDVDALRRDLEDQGVVHDDRWWEEAAPAQ